MDWKLNQSPRYSAMGIPWSAEARSFLLKVLLSRI